MRSTNHQTKVTGLIISIVIAGPFLSVSTLQAAVYKWQDTAGIAHYTNREYDIPARYKAKAKILYPDAADSGQSQAKNPAAQATPPVQMPPVVTPQTTQGIPQAVKVERTGAQINKSSSRASDIKPGGNRIHRVEEEE